ncbi:unnamed protein product [Peniophora sp. CBMAI 1063]|nr:unnamed protein product [Peniophora sp. CBMAI 1063]
MDLLGLVYEVRDSLLSGKFNHNDPLTKNAFTTAFRAMQASPQSFSALVDGLEAVRQIDPDDSEYARIRERLLAAKHARLIAALRGVAEATSHRLRSTYPAGQSPIFRVPAELLANIFVLLHDESPERDKLSMFILKTLRLVCRHFRDVIDNQAALWNPVFINGVTEREQTAIQRTKNAPIIMRLLPIPSLVAGWTKSLQQAYAQLHRVQHLQADYSRLYMSEKTLAYANITETMPPAPMLETFRVRGPNRPHPKHKFVLHDKVFSGQVPSSIKEVALDLCEVNTLILLAPSLASLKLKECDIRGTINTFMDSLSRLPSLRSFHWHNSTFIGVDEKPDPWISATHTSRSVALTSLRTLILRDKIPRVAKLLSLLDLPGTTNISLLIQDYNHEHEDGNPYASVHAALEQHLTRNVPSNGAFRTITFSGKGYETGAINFLAESFNAEDGPASLQFCIIRPDDNSHVHSRSMQEIISWPIFHSAATTLRIKRYIHATSWPPIIRYCTHLDTIEFEDSGTVLGFGQTLADHSGEAGVRRPLLTSGPEELVVVPRLRKIVLRQERLSIASIFTLFGGPGPDTALGVLSEALRRRQRAGFRLEQLSIFGCDISQRGSMRLKRDGWYKRLLWDGKLNGVDERREPQYRETRRRILGIPPSVPEYSFASDLSTDAVNPI